MKRNSSLLVHSLLAGSLAFGWYALSLYPQRRVLTWFEIATDGMAPHFIAEDSRRVLGRYWMRAFQEDHMQDVVKAVAHLVNGSQADIIELAAGSGLAAALWNQALSEQGSSVRTVLSDLQPTPITWKGVVDSYSNVSYIDQPVDATAVVETVTQHYPNWGKDGDAMEIRMIHFALHHLTPNVVQGLLKDAVESNAILVIGDLTPSIENVLLTGIGAFYQMHWFIPTWLKESPWKIVLLPMLPMFLFMTIHDGAVSTLRSYSHDEIEGMLEEYTSSYQVQRFEMYNIADHFGLQFAFLQKPHIQFFVAAPTV